MQNRIWMTLVSTLAVTLVAIGCGPEQEPGERDRAEVDHDSVQQSVAEHGEAAAAAIAEAVVMLETSAFADEFAGEECVYYDDYNADDGYDEEEPPGGMECEPTGGPDADDVQQDYDELAELIEQRIFHEDNVEAETGDAVLYLLDGQRICDEDDYIEPEGYDDCVEEVDAAEIRLEVAKYTDGSLQIDVLVGPDEIHPVTFASSSSEIAVTANLGQFEPAAEHLADVTGEDAEEFPDQFSGQVRAGLATAGSEVRFSVDILDDLEVSGDDFELFVEASGEVFALGADTGQELFESVVDFGQIEASGQYTPPAEPVPVGEDDQPDDFEEPEQPDPVDMKLQMAGVSATTLFDPGTDDVQFEDVGLGGGPTKLFIQDEEVLNIDLSAGVGGLFDAAALMMDDGLKLSVEPGVELNIGFGFHRVLDEFDDFEDWMLDETLTIELNGDANPALLLRDAGLEVLRGHLSLQSEATDAGATAYAGQCLIEDYGEPAALPEEDGYDDDPYAEDDYHPFEAIEAGQCE